MKRHLLRHEKRPIDTRLEMHLPSTPRGRGGERRGGKEEEGGRRDEGGVEGGRTKEEGQTLLKVMC